jgi:hypothetical protein
MTANGVSEADIAVFFGAAAPAAAPGGGGAAGGLAAMLAKKQSAIAPPAAQGGGASDPKFAQYAKMKKMGLPEGAVRNKMTANGVSEADIAVFFGVPVGAAAAPRPSPPPPRSAPPPLPAGGAKSSGGGGLAAMLAAKQSAMQKDGVSTRPVVVRSRSGGKGGSSPRKGKGGDGDDEAPEEDEFKEKETKSLFWKKIKPTDIRGTLFARLQNLQKVSDQTTTARAIRVCLLDEPKRKVLRAKFATRMRRRQLTEAERLGQEVGAIGGVLKKGSLTFLPSQRFNNIAIKLKQAHLTSAQVKAAVLKVDTRVLDSVIVETLMDCAPVGDDVESLEPFFLDGRDPDMLATVERFWYD